MTIIDKIKSWDTSALSLVCESLVDLDYFCTIEFCRHNGQTGIWICVKIENNGKKCAVIQGSTLSVAKKRLIEWAEKNIQAAAEIRNKTLAP
jgi:hypothetical protein